MKQKTKRTGLQLLGRIFNYTKPYPWSLWGSVILAIALAVAAPIAPYLIQLAVDQYIVHKLLYGLVVIISIQIGVLVLESLLRFVFMYVTNWMGQSVVHDIRLSVFKKIIHQRLSFFDTTPVGTLTTRTVNDIEAINEIFNQGLISIIADILTILAILGVMLYTDWKLTLICLSVFPLLIVATYFFKESVKKSFQRVRAAVSHLNAYVQEHLSGMYLIQVFNAEEKFRKDFRAINERHRDANISAIFAYSVFYPVVEIISALSIGLLVWWGAGRMLNLEVTQGTIIAFILYINLLFRPLRQLADKFNTLQMGLVAADQVFEVLDNENKLKENGTHRPLSLKGAVSFKDVHFSYVPGSPVLKGISFDVTPGKTMALVGHTGAGKTSIISILNRLYDIQEGQICIDGIPLEEYDIYELRKHMGIVLQDVFLFTGSIIENITLSDDRIPREEVERICKLLGIHDFIMRLPGNYDFNVRERGNTLSQGQRQLLSFARALIYNPSILILDEATASVDSESEQLIQKAIDKLVHGRTAIVIAHRLSTIRKADQILVLDAGQIIERGTHHELMQLENGTYHKMYTKAMSTENLN